MKAYSWADTFEVERRGEAVLDAVFGRDHIVVKATRAHQKQKIDRFHIHRKDGRQMWRVDYKVDAAAGKTGNLALEHISVRRNGRVVAKGWIHTTIAHYVISFVPAHDTAYVLPVEELRARWGEIQEAATTDRITGRKLRQTSTPGSHITEFYAVPIHWLRENGFIENERAAIFAQYRLPLRAEPGTPEEFQESRRRIARRAIEG